MITVKLYTDIDGVLIGIDGTDNFAAWTEKDKVHENVEIVVPITWLEEHPTEHGHFYVYPNGKKNIE